MSQPTGTAQSVVLSIFGASMKVKGKHRNTKQAGAM